MKASQVVNAHLLANSIADSTLFLTFYPTPWKGIQTLTNMITELQYNALLTLTPLTNLTKIKMFVSLSTGIPL